MRQAKVLLDRNFTIGRVDRRLFGAFVEHLGRGVYGGIYEPGHPTADEQGFRRDVLDLVEELGPTIIKYPGGNFVSTYDGKTGSVLSEKRPRRLNYAWQSTEPNTFGTNEFIDWCRLAGVEPMLVVNLGTRGPQDAGRFRRVLQSSGRHRAVGAPQGAWLGEAARRQVLVPGQRDGRPLADRRRRPPRNMAALARKAAKIMRWADNSIELAASGSSGRNMATFGAWDDDGAGARLRSGRLDLAAHLPEQLEGRHAGLPRQRRPGRRLHRGSGRHRRRRRRASAGPRSGSC